MAIFETKLIEGKISRNGHLNNYSFIHYNSIIWAGGVELYLKNTLPYKIHKCSKTELTKAEHLLVEIQTKQESLVEGVVHRHPDKNAVSVDRFSDKFNELLLSLNCKKNKFCCVGDFHVDLMKITNKEAACRYANMR